MTEITTCLYLSKFITTINRKPAIFPAYVLAIAGSHSKGTYDSDNISKHIYCAAVVSSAFFFNVLLQGISSLRSRQASANSRV